jgi:hypothetical protein
MADYFTSFSCLFETGSPENIERAAVIRDELAAELEREEGCSLGFNMEAYQDSWPGTLWISSQDFGESDHVIAFVLRCAEAFDLHGRWGFVWSLTCSKPRLDGFGGGAQLIDLTARKSIDWIDCDHWLAAVLAEGEPADPIPDSI